eukprot:3698166-Pyramimonas_sp.AAC.1
MHTEPRCQSRSSRWGWGTEASLQSLQGIMASLWGNVCRCGEQIEASLFRFSVEQSLSAGDVAG